MFGLFTALSSGVYTTLATLVFGLDRVFWTLFW